MNVHPFFRAFPGAYPFHSIPSDFRARPTTARVTRSGGRVLASGGTVAIRRRLRFMVERSESMDVEEPASFFVIDTDPTVNDAVGEWHETRESAIAQAAAFEAAAFHIAVSR